MTEKWTRARGPTFLAFKIISGNKHTVTVQKGGIDQFAVCCGRAGCKAIQVVLVFERGHQDNSFPKQLSGIPFETKQQAFVRFRRCADSKETIAVNND